MVRRAGGGCGPERVGFLLMAADREARLRQRLLAPRRDGPEEREARAREHDRREKEFCSRMVEEYMEKGSI